MMKDRIRNLLVEAATKHDIEKLFDECISIYYPELKDLPKPKFSIMYNPTKAGNYKTRYSYVRVPTGYGGYRNEPYLTEETIEINRDLLVSPEKLKSVVWHETIHYAEEHMGKSRGVTKYPKWIKNEIDHSGFFKQEMDRINQQEGYQVISVKDEYIQGQESASEFFVHIFRTPKYKDALVFWTSKNDEKVRDLSQRIHKSSQITHYYVFPTKNIVFKRAPKLIPSMHRWSFAFWEEISEKLSPEVVKEVEQNLEKGEV